MDLVTDCELKLANFRVKELRDLLGLLGLAKHGKKRDLVDRVTNLLTSEQAPSTSASTEIYRPEEVAKIIHDVHRNMVANMYETALAGQTRCPCGSPSPAEYMTDMVECKNPDCGVRQHKACVRGLHAVPPHFNCELCRINLADMSWVGMKNLLHPTRLDLSDIRVDGVNNAVYLNTEFEIQGRDLYLTDREGYAVQVWCILLNDAAHFRMHWPKRSQLEINGIKVETVGRSQYELLGANGRDSGALISMYLKEGLNKISFSAHEHRIFCLGVRLVKPRSIQEVFKLIPEKHEGGSLNDAKTRVLRCIRGRHADRDLEVLFPLTVDLRCPISGARMKTAGRFKSCIHMGCFDLQTFLGLSVTARKSKCPICLKNNLWEDIIIDPYFSEVIRTIEQSGDDTTEIKIRSDGSWFADYGSTTSLTIHCDLSSDSRTPSFGDSLEDPMVISDSE